MIKSLPINHLSSPQLVSLLDQLVTAALPLPAEDSTSQDVYADIRAGVADLHTGLRGELTSPFTEQKATADALRDDRLKRLLYRLRGIAADTEEETPAAREAAARLLTAVDRRAPRFYELGYAENTGELSLLIADWDAPAATEDLATVGCAERYARVKEAHASFVALDQEDAAAAERARVKPAKTGLRRDFSTLYSILHHFARKGVEPYVSILAECTRHTEDQLAIARSRATRGAGGEEPAPESPDAPASA